MKTKVFSGLGCVLWAALPFLASAADSRVHLRADVKEVRFLPTPVLQLRLDEIGADEEFYGQLSIALKYDESSTIQEAQALKLQYPGYRVLRLRETPRGGGRLTIPVLGLNEPIQILESQEGLYFNQNLVLTRKQTQAVRSAWEQRGLVRIEGESNFVVPELQVTERLQAPHDVCSGFGDAMATLSEIASRLEGVLRFVPKRSELAAPMKERVLRECLSVRAEGEMSVSELLSLPVRVTGAAVDISLERTHVVNVTRSLPIAPRLVVAPLEER